MKYALACLAGSSLLLVTLPALAANTENTGGGQPFDNRQPSLALNYIIALQGQFPSRDGSDSSCVLAACTGEIRLFAGNFAPSGWDFANGQILSIFTNTALFSLLGTTYGGDGISTFALPDLRERVPVGQGQGIGLTPRTLGETFGTNSVTLSVNQLPAHGHSLPFGGATATTGNGQPFGNSPSSLSGNYIIATEGDFSRLGEVRLFGGNFAPSGWAFANGQIVPIDQNTALFNKIGTLYGGDGQTTFALPDLRGRVPVGTGTGTGLSSRAIGESFGTETVTLTPGQLPTHDHEILSPAGTTGAIGANQSFTNLSPSLGLNYFIATQGIFPLRSGGGTSCGDSGVPCIAEIGRFAGISVPNGWTPADGRLLPINQNQALFSLLGTTYGGDGRINFALPDLRGRVAIGASASVPLGLSLGTETVTLSLNQLPSHGHSFDLPPVSPPTAVPEPSTKAGVEAIALFLGLGIWRRVRGCSGD
jgi:microcystin-dependent protein